MFWCLAQPFFSFRFLCPFSTPPLSSYSVESITDLIDVGVHVSGLGGLSFSYFFSFFMLVIVVVIVFIVCMFLPLVSSLPGPFNRGPRALFRFFHTFLLFFRFVCESARGSSYNGLIFYSCMDEPPHVVLPCFNRSLIASVSIFHFFFFFISQKNEGRKCDSDHGAQGDHPLRLYGGTRRVDRARLSFLLFPCMLACLLLPAYTPVFFSTCFIFFFLLSIP